MTRNYIIVLLILFTVLNFSCSHSQGNRGKSINDKFVTGKKMDEKEFWKIIDYSLGVAGGDLDAQQKIIVKKLSDYMPEQIIDFELIFSRKLIVANDFNILAAAKIIEGSVTDDGFLYFRCWLISRGEKTFGETIKNPDYLAGVVENGIVADFESLLYVSTEAYKNKTAKQVEDETFPREVAYKKGINYDFGGPEITGKDWKEDDLPKLYPKLWNKFN